MSTDPNLISGYVGGAVTTTTASSIADPAGSTISIGGSGLSAMRATTVGLGLANFTVDGLGMNPRRFSSRTAAHIAAEVNRLIRSGARILVADEICWRGVGKRGTP